MSRSVRRGRLTPWRRRVLDAEFERLLDLDEAERSERLKFLATHHPRLTRRLGPLLDALADKADHLEAMIREVADSAVAELDGGDTELPAGTRLGAWRLLESVGHGGMGRVYRAERADGAFEMTAAVKLIRVRRDRRLRMRLLMERQLLARLDHPNIARILDGGSTEDDQAWLAMEWVDGQDLGQCRDREARDLHHCLNRFLRLVEAVHHAHQRQIVHGDIKPANVRIGEDGRVRLLDFGVARLLADESSSGEPSVRALTPAWSAPELRRGEPVSTQSDIWALGALLHWMLTGATLDPEQAVDIEALSRRLGKSCPQPRDLAAVIAVASAHRPDDRYPSAAGLMRDIERYLTRQPVLARSQTRRYVLTRFIQRNPMSVGASALATVLLVLGLAGTAWQARQAALERDRTQLEANKTEKVSEFLVGLFEQADPWMAREQELTARDLVARGAEQIRVLRETPLVQAEMYGVLARVHRGLADYERAGRLAAEAVEVLAADPETPPEDLADAWSLRADTLGSQGRYQEAETAHRRALELVADSPPPVQARHMNGLGLTLYSLGRLEAAGELFESSLAIRAEHQPDSAELAEAYNNLALHRATIDRNREAREYYDQAIELRRKVLGEDHPTTSFSLTNLAVLLVQTGRAEEAIPAFREALAIRENAFGNRHPAVASVLYQLGWAHSHQEAYGLAREYYRRALEIRRTSLGEDHPSVAVVLNAMASVARAEGDHESALDHLERALAIYRDRLGESHHDIALVLTNLGATHLQRGEFEKARDFLERALAMNRNELGENHHHVADNLQALARLHEARQQTDLAADYARRALVTYSSLRDESSPAVAESRALLERIEGGH